MLWFILSFIVIGIISFWAYVRITYHRITEMSKKLPGPKPLPILGNVLDFGTNTQDIFKNTVRLANEYEKMYSFWLGLEHFTLVTDPDYVEVLLSSTKILDKGNLYKSLHPWLGTGLLTSTGQKWKSRRKLITPAFHFKILEQFIEVFNSNMEIFINRLSKHVNGGEFDIYPYVTMYALDNICETSMGVTVKAQVDENSEYVTSLRKMCDLVMYRGFSPWLHNDTLFSLTSYARLQNTCLNVLHNTTRSVLQSRKKSLANQEERTAAKTDKESEDMGIKKRMAFLDLLILSAQKGTVLSDEDIREEVDTIMFEGHDTTTSTMSFITWVLAEHQDVQEKVVEELKNIFGDSDRSPNYQDLQEMKYLEMVIKETLRLYPSVPFYGRVLKEDISMGEHKIPAGSNVFLLPFTTHRDKRYFPNPEKFDPDRFLPENCVNRHPFCYVPFAAGPRNCVGQKFAMAEMKTTTCQLLRHYKFLPGTTPLSLTNEAILKSTTGINVRLAKR